MEILDIRDLRFSYSDNSKCALDIKELSVKKGTFTILTGASGSGKTTFLRMLKPVLTPFGDISGSVLYKGRGIYEYEEAELSDSIGFLFQDVDAQIVNDKVCAELAFSLENMGMPREKIELKMAEIVGFFGLEKLLYRDTDSLSGGEKQLVSLASIMMTDPEVLLLDEPTSMLDPIATEEFVSILNKIHKSLGVTVILSTHHIEPFLDIADDMVVLEDGRLLANGQRDEVLKKLVISGKEKLAGINGILSKRIFIDNSMKLTEGAEFKLTENAEFKVTENAEFKVTENTEFKGTENADFRVPVNVAEFKDLLENEIYKSRLGRLSLDGVSLRRDCESADVCDDYEGGKGGNDSSEARLPRLLTLKSVYYRYSKTSPDVLKDLNFSLNKGEIYTVVGGNGSGKSTFLLYLINGNIKPSSGKVKYSSKVRVNSIYVPQNPEYMFTEDKVKNLFDAAPEQLDCLSEADKEFLSEYQDTNPFDLSGGQKQRLSILMAITRDPDVLILDEVTKGLDLGYKELVKEYMLKLKNSGKTVVLATHDLNFAAEVSDRVGMMFDGRIVGEANYRDFFANNSYYTTYISRINR